MTEPIERIATALEQIALELAEMNARQREDRIDWTRKANGAGVEPKAQGPVLAPFSQMLAPLPQQAGPWQCPEHRSSKLVPAGVSKKTGRAYDAFIVCGSNGCEQRPPRPQAPDRAYPPSQPRQLP